MIPDIQHILSSAKIVSFDIFDTLLLRPYIDPQEVWRVLEKEENVPGFAAARKEADAQTYRLSSKENRETTIEEAYALIPQYQHLMQKEMDLERRVLTANPEMKALWDEVWLQGKKRVIVSDMYLSAEFIQSVLRENGFDGWDGFYLSRDYNARKTTGKLFSIMLEKEHCRPEEVLHIGDNKHSDVDMPRTLGMQSQHYPKIASRFLELCPFAKKIDPIIAGALVLGWHMYSWNRSDLTYWHRLGFVMGGTLGYMYVKWMMEACRQNDLNRILFVARDGYVWQKICKTLYPDFKTDYIYAPRMMSVAVLGAIGSDPGAIADRQRYIETYLKDVDCEKIRKEYTDYISRFAIDEHTAISDGCSSGFSAQRLIEAGVGHKVFCFYLLAMAKVQTGGALYQTNLYSMPWQMLSEFLFAAPTPPIKTLVGGEPVYSGETSEAEMFKVRLSEVIAEGAVACAKTFKTLGVEVTNEAWMTMFDAFRTNLTAEDEEYLDMAKNAADVEQKKFHNIVSPKPASWSMIRWHGIPLGAIIRRPDAIHEFFISRTKGYVYKKKDLTYQSKVVNLK